MAVRLQGLLAVGLLSIGLWGLLSVGLWGLLAVGLRGLLAVGLLLIGLRGLLAVGGGSTLLRREVRLLGRILIAHARRPFSGIPRLTLAVWGCAVAR